MSQGGGRVPQGELRNRGEGEDAPSAPDWSRAWRSEVIKTDIDLHL